jgi:hypothetical protein
VLRLQGKDVSVDTLHLLGWIHDEEGELSEAIKCYEQAWQKDRRDVDENDAEPRLVILYNMTCCLARANSLRRAIDTFAQLCDADPAWVEDAEGDGNTTKPDPDLDSLRQSMEWSATYFQVARQAQAKAAERSVRRV